MHDFGKLVYLDLHKTGSTYVSAFLKHSLRLDEIGFKKHDWIRGNFRADATYFVTIRNPLSLYSSLYRYGLDKRGAVYSHLEKRNALHQYASFEIFLRFLLDPVNAKMLGFGYTEKIASEIGFMSFRYLKLSLQFPMRKIENQFQQGKPLIDLKNRFITSFVLKNESLNEELERLSTELLPQYFDADKAREFLRSSPRINESNTPSAAVTLESAELMEWMFAKESLLNAFYSEDKFSIGDGPIH